MIFSSKPASSSRKQRALRMRTDRVKLTFTHSTQLNSKRRGLFSLFMISSYPACLSSNRITILFLKHFIFYKYTSNIKVRQTDLHSAIARSDSVRQEGGVDLYSNRCAQVLCSGSPVLHNLFRKSDINRR